MNWNCLCGNFIRDKRYCPRCKLVRFRLSRPTVLSYEGYDIGTIANNIPFLLPHEIIENHILISGQTATGKSSFAMNLITKMENTKFLIMDIEGEWKNIIPHLKGKTEYYAVDKNLKINPFDLNDSALVRELLRQTVFAGIDREYSDLSAQMNYVLQDTITQSKSMIELIQNIKEYENSKLSAISKTKTALLVRLNPFLHSPLREIFYCEKSSPEFAKLDKSNIIIDLHALDAKVAYGAEIRLIYNVITMYYLRKMLSRGTSHRVTNLFVADEAQLLVPRILKKLLVTDSWYATTFATRLHKRGCALLLITQSPSNIEQDIFKNIATKISFRLQSQEDIRLIADSAGFTSETELEYLTNQFIKLPQRNAIVSTIGVEPFLVQSDHFEVLDHTPHIKEILSESIPQENKSHLTDDEKRFLENISKRPFASILHKRTTLGWDYRKYSSIVNGLLKNKIIEKTKVITGIGNPKTLYQKTGQIPSVRHEYYVDWICKNLGKLGIVTKKNKLSGADIVIPKLNTAIEIELGTSDMHNNMIQNLSRFKRIIVCSDDKKVIETLNGVDKPSNILVCKIGDVPVIIQKMTVKTEL